MKKASVAIIGSGPAGYTAAVYNARAKLEPVLFAGQKSGGQLMWTTDVENYPGFKEGVPGPELMMAMRQQAKRFGTELNDQYVTAVDFSERPFKLWTQLPAGMTGQDFEEKSAAELEPIKKELRQSEPDLIAEAVIVATGAVARKLGIPGEDKFFGRGVSVCAVCDAAFYQDKITFVVGGGDSAMEDALALTKYAQEVHLVHRRDEFRASKIMQERVLAHDKVKVWWQSEVKAVLGENKVEALKIEQKNESQKTEIKEVVADVLFLAIGHKPGSAVVADQLQVDGHGYIVTGQNPNQAPTMTSVEGVFAAGDVVDRRYMQAITAAGQGCAAAIDAERWLGAQRDTKEM